jgi:hypothetical protein
MSEIVAVTITADVGEGAMDALMNWLWTTPPSIYLKSVSTWTTSGSIWARSKLRANGAHPRRFLAPDDTL